MRAFLTILILILVLGLGATVANAQMPIVQIYFNWGDPPPSNFLQTYDCTPGTTDSCFVVARYFNTMLVGIEYAVSFPAGIVWLADVPNSPLAIGNSPVTSPQGGQSVVWELPQNGFFPVRVNKILYSCGSCNPDSPIVVVPHATSGFVRATRYSDNAFVNAIGMTSIFCPDVIPVEATTWGSIKSLFTE